MYYLIEIFVVVGDSVLERRISAKFEMPVRHLPKVLKAPLFPAKLKYATSCVRVKALGLLFLSRTKFHYNNTEWI